jgi:glycosyltransferase involved in cell wall biosynthesis
MNDQVALPVVPASIRFVPRHIGHHGAFSGYDRLFERLRIVPAKNSILISLAKRLPHGVAWRLWSLRPQATGAAGLMAEFGAAPWIARGRGRLCHFIYGEDTYFYSPLWRRGHNACVATFHYPPQRLLERINPGSLRSLDAAIIVGSNQREALERIMPRERIHFCPHPVDTDYFCPNSSQPKAALPRLVCVGSLFRDYELLSRVHLKLRGADSLFETHLVGLSEQQALVVKDVPGIVVHPRLSDSGLLELYRSAALGILPLTDATANNALLEMMACGLPVVVTSVGGIPDYTNGSAAVLCPPNDADAMASAARGLLSSALERSKQGSKNGAHAKAALGILAVSRRLLDIYALVMRNKAGLLNRQVAPPSPE